MKIAVVDYDPNWKDEYEKEKRAIHKIAGDALINIFHIGSTSVPGLKAKPIIDILLVVNSVDALDQYSKAFERLGYEVMGEFGITGRRYFRKGGDHRTHQIHAFQYDNIKDIERHLSFRDYLRENPQACQEYGQLKSRLAEQYPADIDSYGDGKDAFVKRIESEALKKHWYLR